MRIKGASYNEITRALGIPKSTLSSWFRELALTDSARARLKSRIRSAGTAALIKRNKLQTVHAQTRAYEAQNAGRQRISGLNITDLMVVGASLYWAEGYKRLHVQEGKERMWHTISFVNSDPDMIRIFVHFLQECLGIPLERLRLSMRLYPHINESEAKRYWSEAAGISHERFFKTTFLISKASKGKRPFNRLPWGTLQIEVCDTAKFHYLLGMIQGVKEQL